MDDQRNILIAVVLMAVVWLGYSFFFPQPQAPTELTSPETPSTAAPVPSPQPASAVLETQAETAAAVGEVSFDSAEIQDIVVETERYRAVVSTSGGRLTSFELKDYRVEPDPGSPRVDFVAVENPALGTLRTSGTGGLELPGDLVYGVVDPVGSGIRLAAGESRDIAFTARTRDGLEIRKTFLFQGDSFDLQLRTRVRNGGQVTARGTLELSLVKALDPEREKSPYTFEGPVTLAGEELDTYDLDDLEEAPKTISNPIWSGFETKYFLGAAVPLAPGSSQVVLRKAGEAVENVFQSPPLTLAPGEQVEQEFLVYFGPRDIDILRAVNHRLAEAIDFGFFSPIARPLLHVLKFFYSYVGNYGVAIILLTVIIKLLFWPLTQKSYSSMKAMQKLQPEMQKIRERFKNDRERLNQEIMGLYKKHRVNPLGGCLPMLVQIPVFFALYKVLLGSIELRHASFALWITDLSAKDPYYITPIIMGASMFVQQKMSPSTMDPAQARIFMAMPVVFTFLFLNFPSGLVIYWLVNNLLTIGQQYLINRKPA